MTMCFKPRFEGSDNRVAEKSLGEKRGSGNWKLCVGKKRYVCDQTIWPLYLSTPPLW